VIAHITAIVTVDIPKLWHGLVSDALKLWHGIAHVAALAFYWVERLTADVVHWLTSLRRWIVREIWNPLVARAEQIWDDLVKWGYTAWWYITHPADLAKLLLWPLAKAVEDNSWSLGGILGTFGLTLVLRNARRFAQLVEHIMTAIL
jgi:hypothetical protein